MEENRKVFQDQFFGKNLNSVCGSTVCSKSKVTLKVQWAVLATLQVKSQSGSCNEIWNMGPYWSCFASDTEHQYWTVIVQSVCRVKKNSVHFKKPVSRFSFLSKLWYFQYKSKQKIPQFWKKQESRNWIFKMNGL